MWQYIHFQNESRLDSIKKSLILPIGPKALWDIPKSLRAVCPERLLSCWGKVHCRPFVSKAAEHVELDFQIKVITTTLDVRVIGDDFFAQKQYLWQYQIHMQMYNVAHMLVL